MVRTEKSKDDCPTLVEDYRKKTPSMRPFTERTILCKPSWKLIMYLQATHFYDFVSKYLLSFWISVTILEVAL